MDPQEYDRVYRHEAEHFWYRGLHARVLLELAPWLARIAAPRVLDAGCGTGGLLGKLKTRFGDAACVGVDVSDRALALARTRGIQQLVQGGVERLPFRDASFDAVVSLDVLYHRAVADDAAAARELARVVRPGGAVLLNLPAHPALAGSHDRVIHGARRYRRSDVVRLAQGAGLAVTRLSWFNSLLFPAIALVRLLHRDAPARSDVALPPRPVNALLSAILLAEAQVARVVPLPWGLSVFAVLGRPAAGSRGAQDERGARPATLRRRDGPAH